MKLSGMIKALIAAGGTSDQIAAVVEAAEAEQEQKTAAKRAGNAERQRRFRERNNDSNALSRVTVCDNGVTERDPPPPPAPSPKPPTPPTPAPGYNTPRQPSAVGPKDHPRFAEFVAAYPRRKGSDPRKDASLKFSVRASAGVDPDVMIAGAKGYARSVRDNDPQFTMQMVRFLNSNSWEQYAPKFGHQPALFSDAAPAVDPIVDLGGGLRWPESRLVAKVAEYRANPRSWLEMIGPPPGQPGCRIPQRLIDQARAA